MARDVTKWNFGKLILAIQNDSLCGHNFSTYLVDNTSGDFKNTRGR
jgi:hypothetical protein